MRRKRLAFPLWPPDPSSTVPVATVDARLQANMECGRRKELERNKEQADAMVFRLGSLDTLGRFYSKLSARYTSEVEAHIKGCPICQTT
jgi:hypothetical protein